MSERDRGSDDTTRRLVWRILFGAIASLVILKALLYAAFWLPFREPTDALPRTIQILPLERAADDVGREDEREGFGWVDREAGIVRIPLADAMDLVVDTLPVREDAIRHAAEREQQRLTPTDAGSGRFPPRAD